MSHLNSESPEDGDKSLRIGASRLSPDTALRRKVATDFERFAESQRSILRLSLVLGARVEEIDDLAVRARDRVEMFMGADVDRDALDALVNLIARSEPEASDSDDSSQAEKIATSAREILDQLPSGHAINYLDGIATAMGSPPSDDMLRSSLLVSLVGSFESFCNQMLRECYARQPSVAQSSESTFKWSDIVRFDSLTELRQHVIDKAIDNTFRGGLTDWIDSFRSRFGVSVTEQATSPETLEVFQRRHCIVHNGGVISSRYLESLRGIDAESSVRVGDRLPVDHDYLKRAADALFTAAVSLAWSVVHKMIKVPEQQDQGRSFLINQIYYLLADRRFSLAKKVGSLVPIGRIPQDQALIIRVNRWLAHKLDGSFNEVKSEVERFDTGALSKRFVLAKHALLDQHEEAYTIASDLLRNADPDLPIAHYLTWPLLRGTRDWAREQGLGSPLGEAGYSGP